MITYSINRKTNFMEAYHKETLGKAISRTYPFHRYTQEEISMYNLVNVCGVCIFISENSVIYRVNRLVLTKNTNVIVYPEGFYDVKTCKYYTAISGLKAFYGLDFLQACYIIKRYYESDNVFYMDDYIKAKYPLAYTSCLACDFNLNYMLKHNLLVKDDNNSRAMVFSVLHNRMCIDREVIVQFLHDKKLIVNDRFDLCFLEYEKNNVVTSTKKLQSHNHVATELTTVRRNTTFTWTDEKGCAYENVYVFEDVYQIMSYLTLIKKELVPKLEPNSIMLSLGGIGFGVLKSYLDAHKEVEKVYACLSNTRLSAEIVKDIPFNADNVVNMQGILKEYSNKNVSVETWNDILFAEKAKNK